MVRLTLAKEAWDQRTSTPAREVFAVLEVDGHSLRVAEGPTFYESLGAIPVVDETGHQLTLEADGEAWACLLPMAFRTGDVEVEATKVAAVTARPLALAGDR